MKKSALRMLAVPLVFLSIVLAGCASQEEKANRLFVEATAEVLSAMQMEDSSMSAALQLYEKAIDELEDIIKDYSSTRIAVELVQDKAKIGPFGFAALKNEIIPQTKLKIEAPQDLLACALLVGQSIKGIEYKISVISKIATGYAESGRRDRAVEMLAQATQLAKTDEVGAVNLDFVAIAYATLGDFNRALEIASDSDETLSEIAEAYVKAGFLDQALSLAGKLSNYYRVPIGISVADSFMARGQPEEAEMLISEATQFAGKMADYSFVAYNLLLRVAPILTKMGKTNEASKMLQDGLRLVRRDREGGWRGLGSWEGLVASNILIDNKEIDREIDFINEALEYAMENNWKYAWNPSRGTLDCEIATIYGRMGKIDEFTKFINTALQSARKKDNAEDKADLLMEIYSAYVKGDQMLAQTDASDKKSKPKTVYIPKMDDEAKKILKQIAESYY